MFITQRFNPMFAPEGAAVETDQAAATAVAEAEAKAKEEADTKAAEEAEKAKEAEAKAKAGEVDIEGLEKTDDGYTYTLGNSVYKGETIKEVMAKARKGAEEKDKASLELDRTLRELKAQRTIRPPEEDEDEDEIKAPAEAAVLAAVFQGTGLEPRMIAWDDEKWMAYGEEKGLRDLQIGRMMDRVAKLKDQAIERLNAETAVWLNRTTLRSDITPAVQRMVAASGVNAEEFGPIYYQILKDKQYRGADGLLNTAKILEAMHVEILKVVKPARESALEKKTEEEKRKLAEKRKALGSSSTGVPTKVSEKPPPNIEEASKRALALLK